MLASKRLPARLIDCHSLTTLVCIFLDLGPPAPRNGAPPFESTVCGADCFWWNADVTTANPNPEAERNWEEGTRRKAAENSLKVAVYDNVACMWGYGVLSSDAGMIDGFMLLERQWQYLHYKSSLLLERKT